MAEYISTYITGFSDLIPIAIHHVLSGVKVIKVYDGLIYYSYSGDIDELSKVMFFNNTFVVIDVFKGKKNRDKRDGKKCCFDEIFTKN